MIRYHFDLYPRDDPKDGDRLVRFTKLQSAEYRGEANGTGAGRFTIRADTDEAAFIDPLGLQYVRVVREDTSDSSEVVVGGFWLDNGDFEALTTNQTRKLTFGGAGTLAYLQRAIIAEQTYISGAEGPYDDTWHWFYSTPGAILERMVVEAQDPDRPQDPIPDVTCTFDVLTDSDGNNWGSLWEHWIFEARIGENLLDLTKRLLEHNLYVWMDPDTFELNAWDADTHRRDRTGGAWGASVIRFQAPTSDDITTGNIKSDAKRGIAAFIKRSDMLVGDKGVYSWIAGTSDIDWEGFVPSQDEDGTSHQVLGESQLNARADAGDTLRLRMRLGSDTAHGYYRPFEDILLDDLVTVHTGTGQWDYNEDTFPVAALTISLRPGGDWDAWADLGSTYTSMAERAFQARGVATHSHPPNPQLCRPGSTVDTAEVVSRLYTTSRASGTDPYGDYPVSVPESGTWDAGGSGTGWDGVLVPPADMPNSGNGNHTSTQQGAAGGRNCFYGSFYRKLTGSGTVEGYFRGFALCDAASGIGVPDSLQDMVTQVIVRVYRPSTTSIVGTAYGGHSMSSSGSARWRTSGLQNRAFPPQSVWDDAALGVALTPVNYQDGDFLVIEVGSRNFTPTGQVSGGAMRHTANNAADLPENETETSQLNSWFAITIPGDQSFTTEADGNIDLIGSGTRTKRCSDTEHYHTDRNPTSSDDWESGGWRNGTLWINDTSGATFYLLDKDAGDWLQITSGPTHSHTAEETSFDNTETGNASETVQGAIDRFHPVESTSDPTSSDDAYEVGTVWVNTTDDGKFILVDNTAAAAVWDELGAGGEFIESRNGGKEVVNTVASSGSTETLDLADGNWHIVTLTDNCTFTFAGATNGTGCSMRLYLIQDGTGNRMVTWPASVVWPDDTPPTLSTAAGSVDQLHFETHDGGTTWYGSYPGASSGTDIIGLIPVDTGSVAYDITNPGEVGVTVTSDWGWDGTVAFYDDAGASDGEEAALYYDPDNDEYVIVPFDFV